MNSHEYTVLFDAQLKRLFHYKTGNAKEIRAKGDETILLKENTIEIWEKATFQVEWRNCKQYKEEESNKKSENNRTLEIIGDYIIVLTTQHMQIWDYRTQELVNKLRIKAEHILHPPTYQNQVLLAAGDKLQLWDIGLMKMVNQWIFDGSILKIHHSNALDIVAVATDMNQIILFNIQTGVQLFTLKPKIAITSMIFLKDLLIATDIEHEMSVWSLTERRLIAAIPKAGNHVLESNGILCCDDTTIKHYTFDGTNLVPRLVRTRTSHREPPIAMHFLNTNDLISISRSEIRFSNIIKDEQNVELSRKDRRLSGFKALAASSSRELDFPNILTIHDGQVNTWSSVSKVIAKHTFKADANVAAVSFSGHYGFFDNASFVVQMINMQSGLLRSKFVGHTQRITGIACDNLDSTVYTTSLDGDLRIWDLNTGKAITTLWMNQPIYHLRVHTETRLAALALEDSIKILDLKTEKTIRLFANTPHTNAIVISPNAKLCISSHSDKTIRIHDIPSGSLIDWVLMEQEIVCLDFDRILVASGKSSRAIYMLEVNENQGRGHVINPLTDIPTGFDESIEIIDMSEEENSIFETSVAQLSDDLVTCSLEPRIKWNTLKDLDTIKKRNRPTEAPKKPESAPFFLPTKSGIIPTFEKSSSKPDDTTNPTIKAMPRTQADVVSELLESAHQRSEYASLIDHLKLQNVSYYDILLYQLSEENSYREHMSLLQAFISELRANRHFELIQAWVNRYLTIYSELIMQQWLLFDTVITELEACCSGSWSRIDRLSNSALSVIEFMRE